MSQDGREDRGAGDDAAPPLTLQAALDAKAEGKKKRAGRTFSERLLARTRNRLDLAAGYHKARASQTGLQLQGARHFRWKTSGDSKVRPAHALLDGQIFPVGTGHPAEGFPGTQPRCRCVAVAVDPSMVAGPGGTALASAGGGGGSSTGGGGVGGAGGGGGGTSGGGGAGGGGAGGGGGTPPSGGTGVVDVVGKSRDEAILLVKQELASRNITTLHLNIGGEGEMARYIDLNPMLGLKTPDKIRQLNPDGILVIGYAEELPFDDKAVEIIVARNFPGAALGRTAGRIADEVMRVLSTGGEARIHSSSDVFSDGSPAWEAFKAHGFKMLNSKTVFYP